ncbi:MAG TPA: DUF1254 domain-containing protein [Polyangiales bacterium]|nr:DUF1254 domain-containing protein [Polyangiales bacterium]
MTSHRKRLLLAAWPALALFAASASAQNTPKYNHKIPSAIMTPDSVQTRIGTLKFFDGLPSADTARKVYENLDFMRGVEVFLNFVPATSLEALRVGNASLGATSSNQAVIMEQLLDSSPLLLTGNTDTVYVLAFLDLEKDGPTVVEVPPGSGPGTVNDAFFRFVIDMGRPGPDKGKGGKYLILPSDYKGAVPAGYFEARSPSYVNLLVLRGFLVDGKPDAAVKSFKDGLKIYPLARAKSPEPMQFIDGSKNPFNTIHANDYGFYQELAHVIAKEPIGLFDPELRGLAASIGMRKDKPFQPDARMKAILTESAAVANATARALAFQTREPAAYLYDKSRWKTGFIGGDYQWLPEGGRVGRNQDARTAFFFQATVNTPAMAAKIPGVGSQYALSNQDAAGNYLDGAKNYRLHIPANVPAKDFWSVVLYDPQTRSELQSSQPFPSKNNKRDQLAANSDGSVDLFFGPKAPAGKEANWIQTVAGKGWFTILRLYGPLEPWFEKTWRPGEIEPVK